MLIPTSFSDRQLHLRNENYRVHYSEWERSYTEPVGGVITLTLMADPDQITLAVEDAGPGIPAGKLDNVFERFYSERPAGEKFGTHSGLGLSISKQIIEAHGGRIWAENRVDAKGRVTGARFVFRLPRAAPGKERQNDD